MKLKLESVFGILLIISPAPILVLHAIHEWQEQSKQHQENSLQSYLKRNTAVKIVDWNSDWFLGLCWPVIWLRIANNNTLPIKNAKIRYRTYDSDNQMLNEGTYCIEGEVKPGERKNFFGQTPGIIDIRSAKLSVELVTVDCATD